MAENNVIQIDSNLFNLGKASTVELRGTKIILVFGNTINTLDHDSEAEAIATMDTIDAAIEVAVGNDDFWYTNGNTRYHVGALSSVQKRIIGGDNELWFYFGNSTKSISFGGDSAAMVVEYDAIKDDVEAGADASFWVEDDSENILLNFENISSIVRVNDTIVRIGEGPTDFTVSYPDKATLDSDIASWAGDTKVASAIASVVEALTEENLNGAVITIQLVNDTFVDSTLSAGNFTFNNAPSGATVDSVNYVDENTAEVVVDFDGTDFDVDVTDFSVQIAAAEVVGGSILTTQDLTITAIVE